MKPDFSRAGISWLATLEIARDANRRERYHACPNDHRAIPRTGRFLLWESRTTERPDFSGSGAREFPVVMQQSKVAGKTAVGTKVRAKLEVATLGNGTVVPRNAVPSGGVIESRTKSASEPSRLAIRMDSVAMDERIGRDQG
jgi:hypothetical protein